MREPLLDVKDLSVSFSSGGRTIEAVRNVSFHIHKGEILALVGESGSGKSVSALSVLRLLPYPAASHPSGEILFDGENLMEANEKQLRQVRGNRISMIFQEPMNALNPLHKVERQIGEILQIHKGLTAEDAHSETLELLKKVGIQDPEQKMKSYPHQLSGGQRQRVIIAMALANRPDLLIADEPTTALDVTVQAQILELLKELQKEFGMAVLFITHDLAVVRKYANRVCVMTQGEIVERGDTDEIFTAPQHSYTQHLLHAAPKGEPRPVPVQAAKVISANDLRVWFPIKRGVLRRTVDHVRAVNDVSLQLRAGETLGIVGESGSGKTTLGLALLRLLSSTGSIDFNSVNISNLTNKQMRPLRQDLQIVFQDPFGSLSPRMSVGSIISEGLRLHKLLPDDRAERRALIETALQEVGLEGESQDRFPHEFSGGQRQRIAIARAIALKPKFIMLDEPTSALDMSVQAQIVDLLRDLQVQYELSYLFISHDLKVVRAMAHNIIVLKDGFVVESGTADQIYNSPQTDYTKALMKSAFDLETLPGAA